METASAPRPSGTPAPLAQAPSPSNRRRFSFVGLAMGALASLIIESLRLNSAISFWHDTGWLVIVGAVLGAVLWNTWLRWLIAVVTGGLLVLWGLVAYTPLAAAIAAGLPRYDPPQAADAVFVLASSIQEDGGLTDASMSRIVHGLEILGQGQAPVIVISDLGFPHPSYSVAVRRLLQHLNLHREMLVIGPTANTHQEAVALGRLYRMHEWKRVIVVTSPYHSRRACAAVEHEGVSVVCSPSAQTDFDPETLANTMGRRLAFSSALHERIGLWLYRRRGWIGDAGRRK
jgi:uncharacterized SAM-binding protein YcdF (DUF218 family)